MVRSKRNEGFSFIEILISVILIGLSITALVVANSSFTIANAAGMDLSTSEFLVEQIRELTTLVAVVDPETELVTFGPEEPNLLSYDDIDDFDNATFSPPIDAGRTALNHFAAFSQVVTVENVNATNFDQVVADHASPFVRVTVRVFLNTREISSASWIRARF